MEGGKQIVGVAARMVGGALLFAACGYLVASTMQSPQNLLKFQAAVAGALVGIAAYGIWGRKRCRDQSYAWFLAFVLSVMGLVLVDLLVIAIFEIEKCRRSSTMFCDIFGMAVFVPTFSLAHLFFTILSTPWVLLLLPFMAINYILLPPLRFSREPERKQPT